jgi:hypothetical protein
MSDLYDPREDIEHQIEVGQYYEDDRTGDELQICFMDSSAVLLRYGSNDAHRLTKLNLFKKNVGSGRYELLRDGSVDGVYEEHGGETVVDFERIDGVGAVSATALERAGYVTENDINSATDDELLELDGIGEQNCQNIREYVE